MSSFIRLFYTLLTYNFVLFTYLPRYLFYKPQLIFYEILMTDIDDFIADLPIYLSIDNDAKVVPYSGEIAK